MTEETNQTLVLLVGELKGNIEGMERSMEKFATEMTAFRNSFDNLEKGRLSRLEIQFANLIGKLTIIATVVSLVISIGFSVLQHFWK